MSEISEVQTYQGAPLSQDQLRTAGLVTSGVILCNRCRAKVHGICRCGNDVCLIHLWWRGKRYEYRRNEQGQTLTYAEALEKLIEVNRAIKKGIFNPVAYSDAKTRDRKFERQIGKWLQEKEDRCNSDELSPGTLKDYRAYVRIHFRPLEGFDVRDIGLEQLTNLKDTLSHLSIKTRRNVMNALRNFFHWLKDRGTIMEMPVFPKITGDSAKMRTAIDYESQVECLQRIPDAHRDIVEFLMETGLRPGEACALLVEHVDRKNALCRIERTFSGPIIRETTKQRRKRVIPLSDRACEIVEIHLRDKTGKQYLFINPDTGRNYVPNGLWRIWTKYSTSGVTLYEGTRHSFASQLIEHEDVAYVKELMGHSDIRTTQKYLHMRMSKLRDVVNRRGKVIEMDGRGETVLVGKDY